MEQRHSIIEIEKEISSKNKSASLLGFVAGVNALGAIVGLIGLTEPNSVEILRIVLQAFTCSNVLLSVFNLEQMIKKISEMTRLQCRLDSIENEKSRGPVK